MDKAFFWREVFIVCMKHGKSVADSAIEADKAVNAMAARLVHKTSAIGGIVTSFDTIHKG